MNKKRRKREKDRREERVGERNKENPRQRE